MIPKAMIVLTVAVFLVSFGLNIVSPRTATSAGRQTTGGGPDVHDSSRSKAVEPEGKIAQHEYVLKPWRALRAHLHNKIIHVPIGFALSGFLLSLIALRWREVEPAIRWLALVAALGSIVAYLSGSSQAAFLEGGSKDWVIQLHQKLGIATAALLWIWTASCWIRRFNRWSIVFGGLVVILIIATGFFGGIIAHG